MRSQRAWERSRFCNLSAVDRSSTAETARRTRVAGLLADILWGNPVPSGPQAPQNGPVQIHSKAISTSFSKKCHFRCHVWVGSFSLEGLIYQLSGY